MKQNQTWNFHLNMTRNVFLVRISIVTPPGGVLPYIRYIGMCRPKGYGLIRFGLKSGIDFEHFGLKLGMVIGGTFTKAFKLIFLPSNRGE